MNRRRLLMQSGGYEFVDLGLSSGLLWATCNVGATKETDCGNYYQWGAGAVTYKNEDQYHVGSYDDTYTLPSSADTATQVMGEGWRMPTKKEFSELIHETLHEFVTDFNGSGINGYKFTSMTNPNAYIFLPYTGLYRNGELIDSSVCYWTSNPWSGWYGRTQAYRTNFFDSTYKFINTERNCGIPVRGVISGG